MGFDNISDAVIEALHHVLGSGCSGAGEAMLDTQLLAQQVQLMVTTGLLLPTGEQAISELFTVVGKQTDYLIGQALRKALKNALAQLTSWPA